MNKWNFNPINTIIREKTKTLFGRSDIKKTSKPLRILSYSDLQFCPNFLRLQENLLFRSIYNLNMNICIYFSLMGIKSCSAVRTRHINVEISTIICPNIVCGQCWTVRTRRIL